MPNHGIKYFIFSTIILLSFSAQAFSAHAAEDGGPASEKGRFDVKPASFGIELAPGESAKKTIEVSNWLAEGKTNDFRVEIEDFSGHSDPKKSIDLRGSGAKRYGAKDWIKLETDRFSAAFGDNITLEISIEVPKDADVGDHYVAILVSNDPRKDGGASQESEKKSNVSIRSRIGVLFFIRVKGEAKESGALVSFEKDKRFYDRGSVNFRTIFQNKGTVRLRPQGMIEIRSMFGKMLDVIEVGPYNVLRESSRAMEYGWKQEGFLFGRYSATIRMDRGYGDATDEKVLYFWIIPWKSILIFIFVAGIIIELLRYIHKKIYFEVRIKKGN